MVTIGRYVRQKGDYEAFIPKKFPPKDLPFHEPETTKLLSDADLLLGKLDGLTKLLPDINFFIFMYIKKEATYSSQVEGTKANLTDALQAEVRKTPDLPDDVDDILHYIQAMNLGLQRLTDIPLSLRLIKEVHKALLTEARSSTYPKPGEFRRTQNWVMGTNPTNARFVPPPPEYVIPAMSDLEKFFYSREDVPELMKAALIHSQFETIHPFIDGNGRTGRLLITFYLCHQGVLERPVLYLSAYFRKHRDLYFALLDEYRQGRLSQWLQFFLRGISQVAKEATETSYKIVELRERDMQKVSALGRASKNALVLLRNLYKAPIVNVSKVREITGLSREGANRLVKRFLELGILSPRDKAKKYGRTFVYDRYLDLFEPSQE